MAHVELRNLTRRFAGSNKPALHNLNLTIEQGELVVLVGPSGCGKSTTLRLVAGLEDCDGGDVLLEGRNMTEVAPQDRDMAMVFQGYALYPHMRAGDIIAFPLKMRGVKAEQRRKLVDEAADMLSIRHLLHRRPDELSGGERQRVAMGRALVRRPKVFLFDEPLSNLDAALRAEIRVEIGALVRRLGTTTIYVTHDHVEAMTLGDRIAVMRAGKIEHVGTPRELYERPATSFVASFLGSPSMNINRATRQGSEWLAGSMRVRLRDSSVGVDELMLGVRPEHLRVGTAAAPGDIVTRAVVKAVEPLGAETFVHMDAAGASLKARIPGFDAPSRGDSVEVCFSARDVHAFAADDGGARLDVTLEPA